MLASRVFIGKSPVCEVRLSDQEVSRRHAAIEIVETRLELTDLDSTNGTRVDGVHVAKAYLAGGETVRVGKSALRVERTAQTQDKFVTDDRFGRVRGPGRPPKSTSKWWTSPPNERRVSALFRNSTPSKHGVWCPTA